MTPKVRTRIIDFVFLSVGALLALVFTPLIVVGLGTLQDIYDAQNPPAKMSIYHASYVDKDTLRLQFRVERLKPCEFARLIGFSGRTQDVMEPAATLRREDGSAPISYPVGSIYTSVPWIMEPIYGPHIRVYGHYICGNRLVQTKLIDEQVEP